MIHERRCPQLPNQRKDDRGRIYLGTGYANKRVTVAVVEVEADRPDEDELAAAYREASESAEALAEEWGKASDEAWNGLDERARRLRFDVATL